VNELQFVEKSDVPFQKCDSNWIYDGKRLRKKLFYIAFGKFSALRFRLWPRFWRLGASLSAPSASKAPLTLSIDYARNSPVFSVAADVEKNSDWLKKCKNLAGVRHRLR
jgi:hypothetical protein